jgi:hypothetical protein
VSEEETAADYTAAKGPFHDLRLHVVNLCSRIHKANAKWWTTASGQTLRPDPQGMLVVCVPEFIKALKNSGQSPADVVPPQRPELEIAFADMVIRVCDTAAGLGFDLGGAVAERMEHYSAQFGPNDKKH